MWFKLLMPLTVYICLLLTIYNIIILYTYLYILLMVILADQFEVPSRTLCLMLFICWMWINLVTLKSFLISSKISGLFLSRIFILSFIAVMICCVWSSAPIFELFSATSKDDEMGGTRREE